MGRWLSAALGAAIALQPATANDSTAETAAGGLVLTRTDAIDMVSEDLFVSADRIRIRYVFRNMTDEDVRTIVAFPMPERDFEAEQHGDVAFPHDFETRVDGVPVVNEHEVRAFVGEEEFTSLLTGLGVPVTRAYGEFGAIEEALGALPEESLLRLAGHGLINIEHFSSADGDELFVLPRWTVRETYHWEQLFPAGEDVVVEHSYVPGTGGTAGSGLAEPGFRESEAGRELIARYCIDESFLAGIDRMILRSRAAGAAYPALFEQRVAYVLTTGANWRSPIGEFRLVVDKGDPANIVSFCAEGVRRISPTRFEVRHSNWVPERDLELIILAPVAGP